MWRLRLYYTNVFQSEMILTLLQRDTWQYLFDYHESKAEAAPTASMEQETRTLLSVLECKGQFYSSLSLSVNGPEVKNHCTCVIMEKKFTVLLLKAQNWSIYILMIYNKTESTCSIWALHASTSSHIEEKKRTGWMTCIHLSPSKTQEGGCLMWGYVPQRSPLKRHSTEKQGGGT